MEEEDQGRRLKWSTYWEQGGKILILRRSKSFPRLMRVSAVPLLFFGSPVNRIVTYFNDEIKFE